MPEVTERLSTVRDPVVSVRGLTKTFAGTRALRGIDIDFLPGEIHAICGGNGSGKSTMIKILSGVYEGDEGGTLVFNGESHDSDKMTPAIAHRNSVRTVHQDLAIFADMNVAENLAIDAGFARGLGGRIKWRAVYAQAARLIEAFNIPAKPKTRMSNLSLAVWTEVAIARSLRDQNEAGHGLLILDEPTAALPIHEVETMITSLKNLAAQGQSILYVSHRLDEVIELADKITVLRDGQLVGTYPSSELDEPRLIELMLGKPVDSALRHDSIEARGEPVFEVRDLVAGPVQGVTFSVRPGEVLGIAGLLGSGRSTILRTAFGVTTPESGDILLDGKPIALRSPRDAMAHGISMVPESRVRDAAFMGDSTIDMNMSVGMLRHYWSRLTIRQGAIEADSDRLIDEFGVKASSGRNAMASLSGGNQQKVIIARWLRLGPRVLLLDEPTQGVDAGARADIYRIIRSATSQGLAVIVVASDLDELALVVDRAVVLRKGKLVAEVSGHEMTAQRLAELSYADAE